MDRRLSRCLGREAQDLVLLDLAMPEVSGAEVLTAMSGDERLASIPVIVISAQERGRWHLSLNGAISVSKPDGFQLEELLRAVEAICGAVDPPRRYLGDRASPPSLAAV